jgi:hypothetical protein
MNEQQQIDLIKLLAFAATPWIVAGTAIGLMRLTVWAHLVYYWVMRKGGVD